MPSIHSFRKKILIERIQQDEKTIEFQEARIKQLERRFPMLDGLDIDWVTAEKFYEMYSFMFGTSQSLERLAERGGRTWDEIAYIIKIYKKKKALEDKDGT